MHSRFMPHRVAIYVRLLAMKQDVCLKHGPALAFKGLVLAQCVDALKIDVHLHLGAGVGIQLAANSEHELGQALQILLLWSCRICKQPLDALVHDLLRQHSLTV